MPRVSNQLRRFKLTHSDFQYALEGKRGLIIFTPEAFSQQLSTTFLRAYAVCCYVTVAIYYVLYKTVINLSVGVQSLSFGKYGVPLH